MEEKKFLSDMSLKDVADSKPNKSWSDWDYLLEVTKAASRKYDREKAAMMLQRSCSSSQRQQRLLKEKPLKKPMIDNPYVHPDHIIDTDPRLATNQKSKTIKKKNANKKDKKEKKEEKKKEKQKKKWHGPEPPPNMPLGMKNFITNELHGTEIILVIQKALFATDCSLSHNRLSMPINKIRKKEFLRGDEAAFLETRDKYDHCTVIQCLLIDPELEQFMIGLRMWDMPKRTSKGSSMYVLATPWIQIVDKNKFCEDVVVQVWSFRVGFDLCFALVKVADPPLPPPPPPAEENGASSSRRPGF
ncbi:B3 domain-containing protein At3g25182-like [Cornus florida]|uniref:B3 domain-containing protein At3g25182-like n=1 Tax=Cornus florida TaxID=4283 RepID=UPI00289E4681|nr:B3 domain-containing protein At3g25182-like [Cornus florida]